MGYHWISMAKQEFHGGFYTMSIQPPPFEWDSLGYTLKLQPGFDNKLVSLNMVDWHGFTMKWLCSNIWGFENNDELWNNMDFHFQYMNNDEPWRSGVLKNVPRDSSRPTPWWNWKQRVSDPPKLQNPATVSHAIHHFWTNACWDMKIMFDRKFRCQQTKKEERRILIDTNWHKHWFDAINKLGEDIELFAYLKYKWWTAYFF